jgi:hypothetical protein
MKNYFNESKFRIILGPYTFGYMIEKIENLYFTQQLEKKLKNNVKYF